MNFGKSFTYMFDDENWVSKFLIGLVVSIVPILNFAWAGYGIGIMRNMARGMEKPLPSWDNLGEKFKDGLLVTIATFIYALPAIIVIGLGSGLTAAAGGKGGSSIWVIVASCCGVIYLLAFSFLHPALMIHYARTNSFGALFQIGEVIKLATGAIGDYLMAWVTALLAGAALSLVGWLLFVLCIIPFFLGLAWVFCVTYYAYGQVGMATIAKSQIPA